MIIVIFGAPKPYSAQCRDSVLIRSRYGICMNVAGSTGGKFPVVSGMRGKLRATRRPPYGLSRANCDAALWTRHKAAAVTGPVLVGDEQVVADGHDAGSGPRGIDGRVVLCPGAHAARQLDRPVVGALDLH